MRIGIMGGTFDPIHIAHLILGETAWYEFRLDKVLFMPAGNPPHKRSRDGRASNEERSDMVSLAISDNPHFELSLREMNDDGYTYTYRTLEAMHAERPEDELFFIIGADSLFDFDGWREPQRICDQCTLIVATRNHTDDALLDQGIQHVRDLYGARVEKLDTENMDISSSDIRKWAAAGHPLRYYLPEQVERYIRENGIYQGKTEAGSHDGGIGS